MLRSHGLYEIRSDIEIIMFSVTSGFMIVVLCLEIGYSTLSLYELENDNKLSKKLYFLGIKLWHSTNNLYLQKPTLLYKHSCTISQSKSI